MSKFDPNARLSEEQQRAFLATRDYPPRLFGGTFDSMCSMLYALKGVAIHTHSHQLTNIKVGSPFLEDYRPTYAEAFNEIARQTRTAVHYDVERNFWVFDPPAQPLPFAIDTAEGWRAEDRGQYVCYIPPVAKVGMDIYMSGHFSSDTPDPDLFRRVREVHALRSLSRIAKTTIEEMTPVTIAGVDALFYQTSAVPKPNNTWRQWTFVIEGQAYFIVSSIDFPNEELLWPQVQAMVQSFRLVNPASNS